MTSAIIQKATAADAPAVWAIRNAAIRRACRGFYDEALLDRWTAGEPEAPFASFVADLFYVARADGRIVATGAVDLAPGRVDGIFVHPDWMGQGVGRQVVLFLVDRARAAGLAELRLDATLNAAPFYRRCGFDGAARGIYHSPRGFDLPCVPMALRLGPRPPSA